MTYLVLAFAGIGAVGLFAGIILWRGRRFERRFWEIVQTNPDAAWVRLASHIACFVDEEPGPALRVQYAGPYKFVTTDGVEHSAYMHNKHTGHIYAEIARQLLNEDDSEVRRLQARETYRTDPRGAPAAKIRGLMLG